MAVRGLWGGYDRSVKGVATLLLLPGLLCNERLWAEQVKNLSDIADVIVVDMTQDQTLEDMARRVLSCTDCSFALAGLSMGGYVALEVMRQAPTRVERLALLDTSARSDTLEQTARRKDLIDQVDRGEFKGVSLKLLPVFIHADRLSDEELVADIRAMLVSVGKDTFLRQQQAIMRRPDSRSSLGDIECPTIVICGREDVLTPRDLSEEIAENIPNAELFLIDHCGHLSTMERSEEVNALLRAWLGKAN